MREEEVAPVEMKSRVAMQGVMVLNVSSHSFRRRLWKPAGNQSAIPMLLAIYRENELGLGVCDLKAVRGQFSRFKACTAER